METSLRVRKQNSSKIKRLIFEPNAAGNCLDGLTPTLATFCKPNFYVGWKASSTNLKTSTTKIILCKRFTILFLSFLDS